MASGRPAVMERTLALIKPDATERRHAGAIIERIGYGIAPDDRKAYQEMIAKLGDKGNQAQRVRARLGRWAVVHMAQAPTKRILLPEPSWVL